MPRITSEHWSANRDQILAAARRCFARQGFHGTSMPDIAAEAGLSTGAPYRYFSGKQELILEVARLAFAAVFDPVLRRIEEAGTVTIDELVTITVRARPATSEAEDELLRCGIVAWSEVLQNPDLREHAISGFTRVTGEIAQALRGTAPKRDADARMIVALLHGFMIQRVALGRPDLKALPHAAITGETT
ncbi:TetR/AcrR family transcriptional regulator [Amycolatopsis sp. NBC_01480]|uniref:TetR/AcrR family transcriptional regulator n=1 Tax=Amycolatopsis sp. NBC_01480 TaxID=2903562 RepID=UPI002E2A5D42|nr:helix-turn-helix domain-containing protein [Amycolatopsis sp. NBC_01480]